MNSTRHFVVALASTLLLAACGNGGESKTAGNKDTTPSTSGAPTATASTAGDKGLELIGSSDCTTCHRLHQAEQGASIGPAYDQVAAKYSPAADSTIDRLVHKIKSGGSGIWGTTPMTPHAALKDEDIRTMVTYIMSLKK